MKYLLRLLIVILPILASGPVLAQRTNAIQGYVFDSARTPLSDLHVELQNDAYATLKRTRTDGGGRYYFGGLSEGNYKVRVLPYGIGYLEETQDAEIVTFNQGNVYTSDNVYLDFYLKPDKRRARLEDQLAIATAIFVQEIPPQAKVFYEKGVSSFSHPDGGVDAGFQSLKQALELFPNYYDALNRIAFEYIRRDKWYEALPHLVRAINVNKRSYSCYFMLGSAAFHLKQFKEAVEAFRIASSLNPQSVNTLVKLGMAQRVFGENENAEKTLLKALATAKPDPVPEAFWQLALLCEKLGRFSESVSYLEKYLKVMPDAGNKEQIKQLIANLKAKPDRKS